MEIHTLENKIVIKVGTKLLVENEKELSNIFEDNIFSGNIVQNELRGI